MQSAAYNLVNGRFDKIYFTDVQPEGTVLPSKYALINQFDTLLEPKSVGGGKFRQIASVIMELNYPKGEVEQCRDIATEITHYFSATSFSACDITVDSASSNKYDTASGVKFVVVIDFNYIVRL